MDLTVALPVLNILWVPRTRAQDHDTNSLAWSPICIMTRPYLPLWLHLLPPSLCCQHSSLSGLLSAPWVCQTHLNLKAFEPAVPSAWNPFPQRHIQLLFHIIWFSTQTSPYSEALLEQRKENITGLCNESATSHLPNSASFSFTLFFITSWHILWWFFIVCLCLLGALFCLLVSPATRTMPGIW